MKNLLVLITVALASAAPTMAAAQGVSPGTEQTRAPGLYVQVIDGLINMKNPSGATQFAAGQFGFSPSIQQPPVVLPSNPGIQFTLPPAFTIQASSGSASTAPGKSGTVDCEVR